MSNVGFNCIIVLETNGLHYYTNRKYDPRIFTFNYILQQSATLLIFKSFSKGITYIEQFSFYFQQLECFKTVEFGCCLVGGCNSAVCKRVLLSAVPDSFNQHLDPCFTNSPCHLTTSGGTWKKNT